MKLLYKNVIYSPPLFRAIHMFVYRTRGKELGLNMPVGIAK